MLRRRTLLVLSVIALILLCAASVYADDVQTEEYIPVTRQEFFAYMADWLGLEPLDECPKSFPDIGNTDTKYIGLVNRMVDKGYVIGTTEGTLEPDRVLTLPEMGWVFERIKLSGATPKWMKPEVVTKTVYVDGGTQYVTQYVERHAFEYQPNEGRFYCHHCGQYAPAGTAIYIGADDVDGDNIESTADLTNYCSSGTFDQYYGNVTPDDDGESIIGEQGYLAYNAAIYIDDGTGTLTRITDLLDFYSNYTGTYAFYYNVSGSLSDDGKCIVTEMIVMDGGV